MPGANVQAVDTFNTYLLTIPRDPDSKAALQTIDMNTMEEVRIRYTPVTINLDRVFAANTISNVFIESLITVLGMVIRREKNYKPIAFYDLFSLVPVYKENERAEKEGNINLDFQIGPRVRELLEDNISREARMHDKVDMIKKFFKTNEDQQTWNYIRMAAAIAQDALIDRFGIVIAGIPSNELEDTEDVERYSVPISIPAITYNFIENLIRELGYMLANLKEDVAFINFNDTMEFTAIDDKNGVKVMIRPGLNAKLLIKDDFSTESEDD
jgi:hypothetical protein